MSILDSLARQTARQTQTRREVGRRFTVVPDAPIRPSRVPFVFLVLVILGVGLVGLLLLNTSLQQGSFVIHDLVRETSTLEDRQSELEQRVAALQAPENLAARAEAMGMVPNTNPVFLRLKDGAVLGDAVPAKPRPKPEPAPRPKLTANPSQTPEPRSTAKPSPTASPDASPNTSPNGRPTPAATNTPAAPGANQ